MTSDKVVIELYNGQGDEIKCAFVLVSGSYTTCTGSTSFIIKGVMLAIKLGCAHFDMCIFLSKLIDLDP